MDRRVSLLVAVFYGLLATCVAVTPADAKRKKGELVNVSGQVLDKEGAPVTGVTVILEATRSSYSWLKRQKTTEPPLQQLMPVDADGRFQIQWTWDRHHNEFTLVVAMQVTRSGTPDFEILKLQDLTKIMDGTEPASSLTVDLEQAGYVRWLQTYLADQATEDEEKIFREMGRPGRIETNDRESSWWYFEVGKVYRFLDGEIDQVIHFDPMESRPPS